MSLRVPSELLTPLMHFKSCPGLALHPCGEPAVTSLDGRTYAGYKEMRKGWRCGEAHVRSQHTNPHEQQRIDTNTSRVKYAILQVFVNASEQPRRYGSAFTRQRTLLRSQHRPLSRYFVLQVKCGRQEKVRTRSGAFVRQPCSNAARVVSSRCVGRRRRGRQAYRAVHALASFPAIIGRPGRLRLIGIEKRAAECSWTA
jgi:hypothetical protein